MREGTLVVVGTGIKAITQCTLEARGQIETADIVFMLTGDLITEQWIRQKSKQAFSLSDCYELASSRAEVYALMTERILNSVRQRKHVCAVFYGHPGMFVRPAHDSITQARQEGYAARMLPGISSLDCLFSDLGVDPATRGLQSYSATDFFLRAPRVETSASLVLWQIGAFAERSHKEPSTSREKIMHLVSALLESYPGSHIVSLYQAAVFVISDPIVNTVPLESLAELEFSQSSTLFIPALGDKEIDKVRYDTFFQISSVD